jgi:hypothetical protein
VRAGPKESICRVAYNLRGRGAVVVKSLNRCLLLLAPYIECRRRAEWNFPLAAERVLPVASTRPDQGADSRRRRRARSTALSALLSRNPKPQALVLETSCTQSAFVLQAKGVHRTDRRPDGFTLPPRNSLSAFSLNCVFIYVQTQLFVPIAATARTPVYGFLAGAHQTHAFVG